MPRKDSPQYVIDSYQRKRNFVPVLVWGIAAIIFGLGILVLVLWFTNGNIGGNLFATDTPTPTETSTVTPTVPTSTPTITATTTNTPEPSITPTPEGPQYYTVQEGDNCWSIAVDQFGVAMDVFMAINGMDTCSIQPGQEIIIPAKDTVLPTETPIAIENYTRGQQVEYTVQLNDSLQDIAGKFHTTVSSIMKLNPNIEDQYAPLQAGNTLLLEVNIATPSPTPVPTYTTVPTAVQ